MKKWIIALCLLLTALPVAAKSYSRLDRKAQTVPTNQTETLPQLVNYLTQGLTSEEDKARVLLAWIVYNVDYDAYKSKELIEHAYTPRAARKLNLSTGDIFVTRIGVAEDFAELYQRMAAMAGLDAMTVTGYAGRGVTTRNMEQYRHVWNVVKIDGKWELVDPVWAMRGDTNALQDAVSDRQHQREIKKREAGSRDATRKRRNRNIDDRWFMSEPKDFIQTHYPDDSRFQLLTTPVRIGRWLNYQ